jgi:dTDP-4-amino-4,6-dideoxygalactose transaminase
MSAVAATRDNPSIAPSAGHEGQAPSQLLQVPLLAARLPDADALLPYLRRIDDNRWYTNFGPLVGELEQRLAHTFASQFVPTVVTAANGTAALELALGALQLPAGATVLLPALTFVATATAVIRAGYRPLIADVDPDSWLLTPDHAHAWLANHRIDAVMPVATFGLAQSVTAWDAFHQQTGVPVLIDAAGAFGNQSAARHCHVAFSMHATKTLAAGEGGFVVTPDPAVAARVRQLSNFGIDLECASQVFTPGCNGKLSEYHAAVAHAALDQWPQVCTQRRQAQARYQQMLRQYCPTVHGQPRDAEGVYPILVVALPAPHQARNLQARLASAGIQTRQWYCPTLDRHPAFRPFAPDALPVSHELSQRLLGLPFFMDITPAQMQHVCRTLGQLLEQDPT